MKKQSDLLRNFSLITVILFLFATPGFSQQTVLLTESFESGSGTTPPAGWTIEQVTGTTPGVSFVTSSSSPTVTAAYDGTRFAMYNSFNISSGSTRLKRSTPMSTTNNSFIMVEFAWYEDPGYSTNADQVSVQWSINGTTWTTAAIINRYNAVAGWKAKSVVLPYGAAGQTTLYIAFLFTSANGNNCSMDMVKVTAGPPAPPAFVTIGTGTATVGWPYCTFYMGSRTQMLYTAAQLTSGGASTGNLLSVGFNVATAYPQVMQNFTIRMGPTTNATLTGWVTTGMNTVYQQNYGVPGTGWRDITLTNPYTWNGTSNVIVEICFGDNGSYTNNTLVYGTSGTGTTWHYHADNYSGCTGAMGGTVSTPTPNIRFGIPPFTPGALMGYVKDCNTGTPIGGALVSVGAKADTSDANGFYMIYNLAPGQITVNVTATGYIAASNSATIVAGQVTTLNLLPCPGPKVGGIVTDASTGLPVIGAEIIIAGIYQTMSVAGGAYLTPLLSIQGYQTIEISKTGYDTFSGTILLVPNITAAFDAALLPTAVSPGLAPAVLNGNPGTVVNLSWPAPQGVYELIYDDGIQDNFAIWADASNLNALKFTALNYPVKLLGGKVNLGTAANYPANALPLSPFTILAMKADGSGGMPGSMIDSVTLTPSGFGWVTFSFQSPLTITSGDFYLVMKQVGIPPHAAGLGVDLSNPTLRSYSKFVTGGGSWIPAAGNFMMRAIVEGEGGPLDASCAPVTTTYKAFRFLHGNENNEAMWTSIYTGSNTSAPDPAWPTLPCGPYRWAVKAYYSPPGPPRPSPPTFTNVIGKCWTANVNVCVSLTCPTNPKTGTLVELINNDFPDTNYTAMTDTSGCVAFQNVYLGDYSIRVSRFSYPPLNQNVSIMEDTTLNLILQQETLPPSNLAVDNQNLKATWSPPRTLVFQLDENFDGGFGANQWTTSGGTNWSVSSVLGNPAPSAMFNWTPQVTNYHQYLTSKSLAGAHALYMILKYDIYLDNFGTTNLNSMAVELWNGTTWQVLKTYQNSGGSIPWMSETLDISSQTHNPAFRIRFHASGTDSYDINNWNIDNVKVSSADIVTGPNPCVVGYNFYLNNVLSAFTSDTMYNIPPNQVIYGQTYNACVKAVYGSGFSPQTCVSFMSNSLYPARDLVVTGIECNACLTWKKPDTMFDTSEGVNITPPGLIGYNIYRDGYFIHYRPHPDSLIYCDYTLESGTYTYEVKARYDLTPYGFTGQFAESLGNTAGPQTVNLNCCCPLPFYEPWDNGNFSFNAWQPNGHWTVSTGTGNPTPTADFRWDPAITDYSQALTSRSLNLSDWNCAKIWLDFDVKLIDLNTTGTEKLAIDIFYNGTWHQKMELSNNGTTNWVSKHINITEVKGKSCRIRFVASGENSGNLLHWHVDNIYVYGICNPPKYLVGDQEYSVSKLFWQAPDCAGQADFSEVAVNEPDSSILIGYNVYRTGDNGQLPYTRINSSVIHVTHYEDLHPLGTPWYTWWRYYVTSLYKSSANNGVICESSSDTIRLDFWTGMSEMSDQQIAVYPNPASDVLNVRSDHPIHRIEMMNFTGQPVYMRNGVNAHSAGIDVATLPQGVYFVKITTMKGNRLIKITVLHQYK